MTGVPIDLVDGAAMAGAPRAGVLKAVPVPGQVGGFQLRGFEHRRHQRRRVAPVAQHRGAVERKHLAQPVDVGAEAEPDQLRVVLLQHQHPEPAAQRPGEPERKILQPFAPDHQQLHSGKVGLSADNPGRDAEFGQKRRGAARRIVKPDPAPRQFGALRDHMEHQLVGDTGTVRKAKFGQKFQYPRRGPLRNREFDRRFRAGAGSGIQRRASGEIQRRELPA